MRYLLLSIAALSVLITGLRAQTLTVDPALSASILVNSALINGQLDKTNDRLELIQQGQLAVSGQLVIANNLHNAVLSGLSEINAAVRDLGSVKEIVECGADIYKDVSAAMKLAGANPLLLLFAERGASDFRSRAALLTADVSSFVLKGGKDNLMDSGERAKLLNHIATQLRILRGTSYGMYRAIYWAKMNGVMRSLNPWAGWQNQDQRIANDVILHAKYLKK